MKAAAAPVSPPEPPPDFPDFLPTDPLELVAIARVFCGAFGNCKTAAALGKHTPAFAEALAVFRSRGTPMGAIWGCFTDALAVRAGKPLFGYEAKKAISYLPSRSTAPVDEWAVIGNPGDPLPYHLAVASAQ